MSTNSTETPNEFSPERTLEELRRIALEELRRQAFPPDIRSFYDSHGELKPISEWTPEQCSCLSAMEVRNGRIVKVGLFGGRSQKRARRLWDQVHGRSTNAHPSGQKRAVLRAAVVSALQKIVQTRGVTPSDLSKPGPIEGSAIHTEMQPDPMQARTPCNVSDFSDPKSAVATGRPHGRGVPHGRSAPKVSRKPSQRRG